MVNRFVLTHRGPGAVGELLTAGFDRSPLTQPRRRNTSVWRPRLVVSLFLCNSIGRLSQFCGEGTQTLLTTEFPESITGSQPDISLYASEGINNLPFCSFFRAPALCSREVPLFVQSCATDRNTAGEDLPHHSTRGMTSPIEFLPVQQNVLPETNCNKPLMACFLHHGRNRIPPSTGLNWLNF